MKAGKAGDVKMMPQQHRYEWRAEVARNPKALVAQLQSAFKSGRIGAEEYRRLTDVLERHFERLGSFSLGEPEFGERDSDALKQARILQIKPYSSSDWYFFLVGILIYLPISSLIEESGIIPDRDFVWFISALTAFILLPAFILLRPFHSYRLKGQWLFDEALAVGRFASLVASTMAATGLFLGTLGYLAHFLWLMVGKNLWSRGDTLALYSILIYLRDEIGAVFSAPGDRCRRTLPR